MLDLEQIASFYPEHLRGLKRNLLREYLQYKILEAVYDSEFGDRLAFMGGTAIHMIHQNPRFSEDLDFDNLGLAKDEFSALSGMVQRALQREGYPVEAKTVFKGAYRCYLRISEVLRKSGLSGHREEKLLIELDTEPQDFSYRPSQVMLNKFDVFLRINAVPPDILLAQKFAAIFQRKRAMGRDFYDAVFLMGMTRPNLDYLNRKLQIKDAADLKKRLRAWCRNLDFKQLARDVEPFLYTSTDSKKVLHFREYLDGWEGL